MKDLRARSAEEVKIVVPSGDLEDLWYQLVNKQSVSNLPLSAFEVKRTISYASAARDVCTCTFYTLRPLCIIVDQVFLQILILTASACYKLWMIGSHINIVAYDLSL